MSDSTSAHDCVLIPPAAALGFAVLVIAMLVFVTVWLLLGTDLLTATGAVGAVGLATERIIGCVTRRRGPRQ